MRKVKIEDYKRSQIPEDLLEELFRNDAFKLFVPKDYGGLELDLKTAGQRITETSTHFGGLGWVLNLGAGANWFCGFFDPDAAKTIFTPERTVVAGSGAVGGSFKAEDKSVLLNGSWGKCSGAAHANYFSLNAKNADTGEVSSFVVPRDSVEFSEDKWEIFGLKSTSSLSINLTDVRVPQEFGFHINSIKNHFDYNVFHIPFEQFARVCMSSCFIGIAQCFLNTLHAEQIFNSDFETITNSLRQKISSAIQNRDAIAEKIQDQSKEGFLSKRLQADVRTGLGQANMLIFDEIQQVFKTADLALVEEDKLSHWAYRDVMTAIHHYMIKI
ncbi:acyl-CoA dehydrogenase family protein [Psychroflexus sediminis]|uniref:Acyl-CoA dehydrogenase n=1 Tax=Psychroflexus sediminis TaxID=470826 RepID=A0A1G7WTZ2_9FLAO|nr:hypothetical protein [Psychroflexus sediminis]SDG74750.1 hypothetical protein SAMN04488027_10694 [Psychroflexus sediminis]